MPRAKIQSKGAASIRGKSSSKAATNKGIQKRGKGRASRKGQREDEDEASGESGDDRQVDEVEDKRTNKLMAKLCKFINELGLVCPVNGQPLTAVWVGSGREDANANDQAFEEFKSGRTRIMLNFDMINRGVPPQAFPVLCRRYHCLSEQLPARVPLPPHAFFLPIAGSDYPHVGACVLMRTFDESSQSAYEQIIARALRALQVPFLRSLLNAVGNGFSDKAGLDSFKFGGPQKLAEYIRRLASANAQLGLIADWNVAGNDPRLKKFESDHKLTARIVAADWE